VEADPAQLQQILVNLVVNAIHAMPGGGEVTIRTETDDGFVKFSVEDNGEGMKEEIVDQIFLPFFTTKGVGQGTGLGLAVVHGIVKSHGGAISVESAEGHGSRFDIKLPIYEGTPQG
jgi:signal transduction histidine kinase